MVGRRSGRTRPRAGRNGLGKTPANPMASAPMDDLSPSGPGWPPDAPTTWVLGTPPTSPTAATTSREQHRRGVAVQRGVTIGNHWVLSLMRAESPTQRRDIDTAPT